MTLAGWAREAFLGRKVRARGSEYSSDPDESAREALQLRLLNAEWERATGETPYWRDLAASQGLPRKFGSIAQFVAEVPPTTRHCLQEHRGTMTSIRRRPDLVRLTGGSTSQPVQIPSWRSEVAVTAPNMWWGRSWYGIRPSSRLFLLWGHSHLLGTGLRGAARAARLRLSDRLLGYHRFSAYDLRPEMLARAAAELVRFRPDYVLGYSVALDLFARANFRLRSELRGVNVKAVIGTAESFPSVDSERRLGDLFGCPVAMEYGAVETGLIAHTTPAGGYQVFWRHYLVEADAQPGAHRVRITSLYPRCMPLVRYEIGDEVTISDPSGQRTSLATFDRVVGRCNDYVSLQDGAAIHSEVFSHALRPCAEIQGFQVVLHRDGIQVRFVSPGPLAPQAVADIRDRLGKVHPDLAQVSFERVEQLEQTVAGKTRMIVRT